MLTQELKPINNINNTNKTMELPLCPESPLYEFVNVVTLRSKRFFFFSVPKTYSVFRRLSANNLIEKYKIGFDESNPVASFLLKIYKDSVYIVDLKINSDVDEKKMLETIVQISSERALELTTRKEVKINVTSSMFSDKISVYKNCGFESVDEQTEFEKKSLGEALILKVVKSSRLMKRIKKNPIIQ